MAVLLIPLKDIIINPEEDIDLRSLPKEEAIRQIKKSYGFLSSAIDVSIEDDVAVINVPEERARPVNQALDTYARAGARFPDRNSSTRSVA